MPHDLLPLKTKKIPTSIIIIVEVFKLLGCKRCRLVCISQHESVPSIIEYIVYVVMEFSNRSCSRRVTYIGRLVPGNGLRNETLRRDNVLRLVSERNVFFQSEPSMFDYLWHRRTTIRLDLAKLMRMRHQCVTPLSTVHPPRPHSRSARPPADIQTRQNSLINPHISKLDNSSPLSPKTKSYVF